MDIEEFSDGEWGDVFDELRLLVQRAGFADWDAAMMQSLDDGNDGEDLSAVRGDYVAAPAHRQLRHYTEEFMRFLKSRSRWTLDERARSLGRLLRTTDQQPVDSFSVVFEGRERPLDERTDDIDAMITELNRFHAEISGEDSGFWFDAPDGPDDRGERR